MTKENTVAVIYHCDRLSEKVMHNHIKLERRITRAICDMAEDGFYTFLLLYDNYNSFYTSFIDAFQCAKSERAKIRLTIILPYEEKEESRNKSSAERICSRYADEIKYTTRENFYGITSQQRENLLCDSSAIIIYHEKSKTQLRYILHRAVMNSTPFIYINL